jgi:Ca2+-binding EF-hand superfamily protein
MAEKITEIFDFGSGMISFEAYALFLEKCLNESPPTTLIKLAFRIYDINNDK